MRKKREKEEEKRKNIEQVKTIFMIFFENFKGRCILLKWRKYIGCVIHNLGKSKGGQWVHGACESVHFVFSQSDQSVEKTYTFYIFADRNQIQDFFTWNKWSSAVARFAGDIVIRYVFSQFIWTYAIISPYKYQDYCGLNITQ